MGIACVDELGASLEERWRAIDYDARQFPDLAATALTQAGLPDRLAPDDVLGWALGAPALPRQPDLPGKFGQPPVTLFRGRRFYIDALFWVDGSTSIHQHAFSGAFQVLAGSSIETRYTFRAERELDGMFVVGALEVASTALLRRGEVRPIAGGPRGLIHSLFHLERPSVTIVLRTFFDAETRPQLSFAWPGVGHDPFYTEDWRDRALQIVGLLRTIEHPRIEEMVGELVAGADAHTAYRVLVECASLPDRALVDRLIDRVRDPALADRFRAALRESRRIAFLYSRRNVVKDPELRFFLGVLLNARRRGDVLALVRARVPEASPAAQVAAWVRRLSTVNVKLQAAGVPWQPNLLGIPDVTDDLERALADFLDGRDPPPDGEAAAFLARLRELPSLSALFERGAGR